MFIFDYFDGAKNENVIGEITNTLFYVLASRGAKYVVWPVTLVYPYSLIFTENFILGDHLIGPELELNDDPSRNTQGTDNIERINRYYDEGKVSSNNLMSLADIKVTKLDVKYSYKQVRKAIVSPLQRGSTLTSELLAGCTCLTLDLGVMANLGNGGGWKVVFAKGKFKDAVALLQKTPLATKLTVSPQ